MLKIFSVYDKKAFFYGTIMAMRSEAEFRRSISMAVARGGTALSDYPEDFAGYLLGEFDDQKGIIVPVGVPEFLFDVNTILPLKENE